MFDVAHDELTTLQVAGRVAWLTLNRPGQANAINWPLASSFINHLQVVESDPNIVVLVVAGSGKLFSGGQDLKSIESDTAAGHPDGARELCSALAAVPIPVIAMINGAAVGGGCEIALCCDIRVMAETAKLSLPEIKFGALPAAGGTQRLPRVVGSALASEYLFTGRDITSAEAFRVGLVNCVVAGEELDQKVRAMAESIASRARYALLTAKRLVRAAEELPIDRGVPFEAEAVKGMATLAERLAERNRAALEDKIYAKLFSIEHK